MGLAPKQGFTFIIDSIQNTYPLEHFPSRELQALALHVCPPDKTWPVYGKTTAKIDIPGLDDSTPAVKQGDWRNCGVFTCTNLMCLAFGYRLMCYRQRDLNVSKRHRMAVELATDSFGPTLFDYQLLDIPTSMQGYRKNYAYVPPEPEPEPHLVTGSPDSDPETDEEDDPDTDDDDVMDDVSGVASRSHPLTRIPFDLLPKEDSPPPPPVAGPEGTP